MFFEAMEDILPDLKVIITDGDTQTMLPLESFTGEAGSEAGAAGSTSGNGNTNGNSGSGAGN